MTWDKENKNGYKVKTLGHSRSQVNGSSHSYVYGDSHSYVYGNALGINLGNATGLNLGNATGLNIGSKEAVTVGFDVSFKLAAVLDVSYGFKWEISFVKKMKSATIARSTSIQETKTTKEYNLFTNVKKEMIQKNKIYIGGNTQPVEDAKPICGDSIGGITTTGIGGRRKVAKKNSGYAETESFSDFNGTLASEIYIGGSEKKCMAGNEEKEILGDINYKSRQINITVEGKCPVPSPSPVAVPSPSPVAVPSPSPVAVPSPAPLVKLEAKYSDSPGTTGTVTIKPEEIILKSDTIKLHPQGSQSALTLTQGSTIANSKAWYFVG